MGTRCLTVVRDESDEVCVLYRQHDGYPSAHGAELKKFLSGLRVVNGFRERAGVANGAGCLAAQLVAHFKTECGSFYLYPTGTRDVGENYIYFVEAVADHPIRLAVTGHRGAELYNGLADAFDPSAAEAGAE